MGGRYLHLWDRGGAGEEGGGAGREGEGGGEGRGGEGTPLTEGEFYFQLVWAVCWIDAGSL